ncbi:MAG: FecR domain-containing protein [Burkholderiaceae bacterium]|nr:FecR domain-containing protein [Burkholderiaceae bacterium]
MKQFAYLKRGHYLLCAAALAGLTAGAASAQTGEPGVGVNDRQGTFKTVSGQVTVAHGDVRRAAVVGGALSQADRVITGPNSAAAVVLRDGTVLSVSPNSEVDLAQFQFDSTTEDGSLLVKLMQGSLRMITGAIAKTNPAQVKVTTPTTVVGVRGTDFIVETQ